MEKLVIWKYEIQISEDIEISVPAHSEILSLGVQNDIACIWVKVNPYNKAEKRHFTVVGTGHPIEDDEETTYIFIGTFQFKSVGFVGHLFEIL